MKDKEFLIWLAEQSQYLGTYNQRRLKTIADRIPEDQDISVVGEASVEEKIAAFKKTYSIPVGGSNEALINLIEAMNKRLDQMATDISVVKATQQRL